MSNAAGAIRNRKQSFAAPFRHPAFAVIWTATLVSNVGGWMYSAASGWLMTSLNPDRLIVALVQAASTLPICLFAIPAGALADIFDKRKFLIIVETLTTAVSAIYAVMVGLGLATPGNLLLFTFLIGAAGALTVPAWQAVVPQLVPKEDFRPPSPPTASASTSPARSAPRLAARSFPGLASSRRSGSTPRPISAIVGALLWWRGAKTARSLLPAERFGRAMWAGLRYARHNPHLRATLVRAAGFFLFASAYWALLPLVARTQIVGGPGLYGMLLGVIGVGAVCGAFLLPWLKTKARAGSAHGGGSIRPGVAMVLYGLAREPAMALVASAVAGASWIAALATLTVSAQVALPDWVRGRGLALYTTVFFGCLTIGSAVWGEVAAVVGLPIAHFPRRRRCGRGHSVDVALETANGRRHRSDAVHALAGAAHRAGHRQRSRSGLGDGRIPHPSGGPRSLSRCGRKART